MVTIVRDRVQDVIKKGMTLEQVQGGEPDAGLYARDTDPTPARGRRRCSSKPCMKAFGVDTVA